MQRLSQLHEAQRREIDRLRVDNQALRGDNLSFYQLYIAT
jgi:hypothetical protein